MQKDLKELLSIIKIKIFGETGIETQDVTVEEAEKIFRLAKKHDFAHLLDYFYLGNEEFNLVNEKIKKEKNLALYRYTKQSIELESLKSLFEGEKIEYMPLKGYVIKPFYPEAWMRTSSDIDVLIDKKNLTKVEKLLQENGYQKGEYSQRDVSFFSPTNVHVEIHFGLNSKNFRKIDELETALKSAKKVSGESYEKAMDAEVFLLHHVQHMAQHFMNGGCGIRSFVDLRLIEKNLAFDQTRLDSILEKGGLKAFYDAVKALNNIWFDSGEHDQFTLSLEEFIAVGGVHGEEKQRSTVKQVKAGGKFKYFIKRAFIGYKELSAIFPSLKKCPPLYPFYLVLRWCKWVFSKDRKRMGRTIVINNSITEEEKQNVKNIAEKLELL